MEPEGSLPCLQEPITSPYPGSDSASHFFDVSFNVTFQLDGGFLGRLFQVYPPKLCTHFSSPLSVLYSPYIWWQCRPWRSPFNNVFYYSLTFISLVPNISLGTPLSDTFSLLSFLNVTDWVSHRYKTGGKIFVYFNAFPDSRWEDKRLLLFLS